MYIPSMISAFDPTCVCVVQIEIENDFDFEYILDYFDVVLTSLRW